MTDTSYIHCTLMDAADNARAKGDSEIPMSQAI